jgi:two-component system, LytTR family, sensor kinase
MSINKNKSKIPWRIIIIAWLIICLFSIASNSAAHWVGGLQMIWSLYFFSEIIFFGLWLLVIPLIFWLAEKYKIERTHWFRNSFIHLCFGITIGFSVNLLHELFRYYAFPQYIENPSFLYMVGTSIYAVEFSLLIYIVLVVIYNSVEYFRKYKAELEHAAELRNLLARSELMTLKMQLHPHFLFNTHHAIVGLIAKRESEKAIQMLVKLSDLLRATLDHSEHNEITLREELELISLYLSIQNIRFEDRLKISKLISEDALNAIVPTFLLQPIIENSIRHGIAKRSGSGSLSLIIKKENDSLIVEVSDDGGHIILENGRPVHEGLGIHTTRNRLEQFYNNNFELMFTNLEEYGVSVKIIIPYYEIPRFNN